MVQRKILIKNLSRFAQTISEEYQLQKIILFGSQAAGSPTRHSDVDLLIVSPKFKRLQSMDRAPPLYLKWNLRYPVDFICLTPQEFERKKKQVGIVREAIQKGIEIKAN